MIARRKRAILGDLYRSHAGVLTAMSRVFVCLLNRMAGKMVLPGLSASDCASNCGVPFDEVVASSLK